jgi:hypothetical protein
MTFTYAANNTPSAGCRVLRWLGVALLALTLAGCGTKFFYDRLDQVVGWYLGGLVSLDDDQRSSLDRWLEVSLDWHRESQLERYAAFVRELEAELARPLRYEEYDRVRLDVEAFWRDLVAGTVPQSAGLLTSLSPEQVEELIASLEEEDREDAEELAERSPAERAERRMKRMQRGVERWTGRLDATQREIVAAAATELRPLDAARLEYRATWREQLRAALLAPGDTAPAEIERLLADPQAAWTDAYRDGIAQNRRRVLEMLAELDATLSPAQRARMRARLGDLADDLEALARG